MESLGEPAYKPPEGLKSRLAASYDTIAPTYNSWTTQHSSGPRLTWLSKLLSQLPPNPSGERVDIVELGAGAGLPTTKALLDHSPAIHVLANDISAHQLALLESNLHRHAYRVATARGDMLALGPAPASLAAVVGVYSLIHLPRAEQSLLLARIAGWLRPGGLLLANFAEAAFEELVDEAWLQEGGWMYWSGWGVDGTRELIERSGLEVLESEVVYDEADANFWWVLARKKDVG